MQIHGWLWLRYLGRFLPTLWQNVVFNAKKRKEKEGLKRDIDKETKS